MNYDTNYKDDQKSHEQLIQELSEMRRQLLAERQKQLGPSHRIYESGNFESERPYRLLFDAMREGFGVAEIITDESGKPYDYRILEVNKAAGRLFGFDPGTVVGKTARELAPNLKVHNIEIFGRVALSGQAEHLEVESQALGKWFDVHAFSPEWGKFACMFVDITERKRSETSFEDSADHRFVAGIGIEITERKKMEAALQHSEQRFRALFEHSSDAVFLTIPDGSIEAANPAACTMLGCTEEELRATSRSEILDVSDPCLSIALKDRRQMGRAKAVELTAIRKGGEKFPVEVDSVILHGEPVRSFVIMRDITARKETEKILKEKALEYAAMFERALVGKAIADPATGRYLKVNQAFAAMTGYSPEELCQMTSVDITHPDDRELDLEGFKPVQAGETDRWQIEKRYIKKDGSVIWVNVSGSNIHFNDGRPDRTIAIIQDITERKRAEVALQKSERWLSAILEQIPVGVGLINRQGEFILSNSILRGYSPTMIPSVDPERKNRWQSWDAFGRPLPLDQWPGVRALRGEKVSPGIEFVYTDDSGREVWMLISAVPFQLEEGETIGAIAVIKDITERKKSERQLRQFNDSLEKQVAERTRQAEARSKQMQALAAELIEAEERERRRIADLLHDDLQQMLAAARMQLESVCDTQPNEPALSNIKQLLEESIGKSRRLSHKLSPPVLQHAKFVGALQWLAHYLNDQFGLQVEIEANKDPQFESPTLKVFLFRAVQELLFNVVKHAGIKYARVALSSIEERLIITVSDQGCGFNPNIMDSVTASVGLGLLSLRERARHIGGDLKIESALGLGSRFTLTVPLRIKALVESRLPATATELDPLSCGVFKTAPEDKRVLFVDDHQVMRKGLIQLIAAQPDIKVAGEAANGREAIDRVQALKPDVIVMDVSMPEMDGIEATRHIKIHWPEVRVIALSMFEDEHISQMVCEAGAERFVSKTASTADLLKAIYGSF